MAIEQTANEPTQEEINAIIEESSKLELARIAGVPEPEAETTRAPVSEPEEQKQPAEYKTDKVEEPSLAEQFKELMEQNKQLRKALDTTNGRFGQEVQHIKRRLDQAPTQSAPNLNEVFNRINIDDPAFAELKEEFPELAGHFVTAFQKALIREEAAKQAPAVEAKPEGTQQRQEAQVTERPSDPALYEMALDTLKTKHPDFLDLAEFTTRQLATGIQSVKWKDPKFGEWLDTMPDDVREDILVGGSIEEPSAAQVLRISNIMTEYKKHAATATETTDEPKVTTQTSKPKPKVDLSKALLPSSRQSLKVAMSDDEVIQQAMEAELKRIATGY